MNGPVLTLRWFLNCPETDNLEFYGDEDRLGDPTTDVNVIDNPEGVPWIKKNELVLTTGSIFYKDIDLIAVPLYHSYSDIMRVIFRELELRQLSNQAFVISETRKFCQLFISNGRIGSMLFMLSSYTTSIILIIDYNDKSPAVAAPNLNIVFLLFDCCIMLILNVSHNTVK